MASYAHIHDFHVYLPAWKKESWQELSKSILETFQQIEYSGTKELADGLSKYWITWSALIDFIREGLFKTKVNSILDPWAGSGAMLLELTKTINVKNAKGICVIKESFELANKLDKEKKMTWILGNPLDELEKLKNKYDVIVSCPPFGVRPTTHIFLTKDSQKSLMDDLGNLIILKSLLHLSENGVGFFVIPQGALIVQKNQGVFANLEKFHLHVNAFFALPYPVHSDTSIPSALIVVKHGMSENIFVGELSLNYEKNQRLLANYLEGKEGKDPSQGRIIARDKFRGYQVLVAEDRAERMAQRMGLEPVSFRDVVIEVNLAKAKELPGFEERNDAIYLPLIGSSDVVTSTSELKIKPHNYAQLILNTEKVDVRFLANFMNTPFGRTIRESAYSGMVIPKISKTSLFETKMYLPEKKKSQLLILDADLKINTLITEMQELRTLLWSRPSDVSKTVKRINMVNRQDRFEDWLDNLPFPLASILWAYHIEKDNNQKKLLHLDHFFEALPEFIATIYLSAFKNDSELFIKEKKKIKEILEKNGLSMDRSTIGTWVVITERLAKQTRKMINSQDKAMQLRIKNIFKLSTLDILENLSSSKIVEILQKTNRLRNEGRGHGGIVSDRTAGIRNSELFEYLNQLRQCFGDIWSRWILISTGKMNLQEGIFKVQANSVMGTRTPFKHIEVEVNIPLNSNKLHLIGEEDRAALELLPIIKIAPAPETELNACYFYNRIETDAFRYISYHYEAKPEIKDSDLETAKELKLIFNN
ncbi:MAG TPA: N-6 DNA methylase [archaeon]|nr:N-6 DNA methylase [archaeon]